MNYIDYEKKISLLDKEKSSLMECLFQDDNIEKIESIVLQSDSLRNEFFNNHINWNSQKLIVSDYLSISPNDNEIIYSPTQISCFVELIDFKISVKINESILCENVFINSHFKVAEEFVLIDGSISERKNNLILPDLIDTFDVIIDHSFLSILINDMLVFKVLKPSNAFSLNF